jgi:hypothetical protein
MIHSPDRSYDSLDKESISCDHSTHGDNDLDAERKNARFLDSSEPMVEGSPKVARGYTGLPPYEAITKTSMIFDLPLCHSVAIKIITIH